MTRKSLFGIVCAAVLFAAPFYFHAEASAAAAGSAPAAVASAPEGVAPAAAAPEPAPAQETRSAAPEHGEPAAHEAGHGEAAGGEPEGHHADNISFFGLFSLPAEWWTLINLLLLVSALVYFLRGGAKKFFSDRAAGIKAQLEEATNAKTEAEKRLKELQSRMDALSGEVEALRAEATQAADKLKEQILREAGEEAARLRQQAKDEIAAAEREARGRLQAAAAQEASQLALQMAGAKLQNEDHDRLIDGLADSLNEKLNG
jgi:F-type H+-transporting ATPase subunit b